MSRDYAKKGKTKKKIKKTNVVIWLMLLLAFGMFISALVYIKKHRNNKPRLEQKITKIKKTISKVYTNTKFDFYSTSDQQKKPTKTKGPTYMLDVATMNKFANADHLKARLTLLGFSVNVNKKLIQGKEKYKVSVGPYEKKDKALADQKKLKRNKINGILKIIVIPAKAGI